ncbi:MAG TPA: multicopper oxidase family protein [Burkholderiales bacterium]|nr:multicopper oxidase family protein [Burkholderiales bacterium]
MIDARRRRLLQATLAFALAGRAHAACRPSKPVADEPLRRLPELALDRSVSWGARGVLRAAPLDLAVAGQPARLLTYGETYPGRLIRARAGETFALRFENRLDIPSNLHFHGVAVSPSGNADNVWVVTPPGADFDYELPILEEEAGLFWIHPHVHGNTARPLFAGLAAPLVVENAIDRESELVQAEEHVLVLKDLTVENCAAAPHRPTDWILGKEGEMLLVNGQIRPRLHARRSLLRLRLVNASNARFWKLALDSGEPLHLIALDGRFLESRVEIDELLLVPAGRAEVLIDLSHGGTRRLIYKPSPRRGLNETPVQPVLTLLPPDARQPVALPQRLATLPRFDETAVEAQRPVQLAALMINHRAFHHRHQGMQVTPTFEVKAGAREIWIVRNDDVMDHPFHLHTWHFDVLSVNGKAPPFAQHRDTIGLRPGDVARLGIHFDRYTGRTMFHCHIAEHADQGMMAVVEVK